MLTSIASKRKRDHRAGLVLQCSWGIGSKKVYWRLRKYRWKRRTLGRFKLRVFRLSCEARIGDCTAEARWARSKEFLIKKFSELCELCASVVNPSSQETRNNLNLTALRFLELAELGCRCELFGWQLFGAIVGSDRHWF